MSFEKEFEKILRSKEKFHQKLNEDLRDRVKHTAKETFKIIERLKNRGYTDRDILKDISKSREVKEYYENNQK